MQEKLARLKEIGKELTLLAHTGSLLGWDQETYMPSSALEERGEQLALLQGIEHDKLTADEVGELLAACGVTEENPMGNADLADLDRRFLRSFARNYWNETKIPKDLIVKFAKQRSRSQAMWIEARKTDNFSKFAPELEKNLDFTKQIAEHLGYEDHIYDALLDRFEPFMKASQVKKVFAQLKTDLGKVFEKINSVEQVDDSVVHRNYPIDQQEAFGKLVLEDMGYDWDRGRLDVTAHPFTTTLGSRDVRVTTRYEENFFNSGLYSIIHEGGHGLYELGFSPEIQGNILANGTSLGIHESQSRTWENMIGRSEAFWNHYFPKLQEHFPEATKGSDANSFFKAVNKVHPSLIRVEADEVTYSLHVILRFELEMDMVSGKLDVKDLPQAWNSKMKELLGIVPESDANGVLQDIHWSMGAIGYFPTYALGNLFGAQFYRSMEKELGSIDALVEKGELKTILGWLQKNIHAPGSSLTADELTRKVTGESLNPQYFTDYLDSKYSKVYGY
jgi:carboxypeptidase Taq